MMRRALMRCHAGRVESMFEPSDNLSAASHYGSEQKLSTLSSPPHAAFAFKCLLLWKLHISIVAVKTDPTMPQNQITCGGHGFGNIPLPNCMAAMFLSVMRNVNSLCSRWAESHARNLQQQICHRGPKPDLDIQCSCLHPALCVSLCSFRMEGLSPVTSPRKPFERHSGCLS